MQKPTRLSTGPRRRRRNVWNRRGETEKDSGRLLYTEKRVEELRTLNDESIIYIEDKITKRRATIRGNMIKEHRITLSSTEPRRMVHWYPCV